MNKKDAFELWTKLCDMKWTPENVQDIQDAWNSRVCEIYKEIYCKKQSNHQKAYNKLVKDGHTDILRQEFEFCQEWTEERYKEFQDEKKQIESSLREFAKKYIPEKGNDMHMIKLSQSWAYSSQPSHNKYARNALNGDKTLLEIMGFNTEVKSVNGHTSAGMYPSYWEDYELWSNISEFDFYMLKNSGKFVSVLNWAVLCWKNASNPKVYFPFLSDSDYEKSQALAYHCDYEITSDNMMLELSWDEINQIRKK